MSRRFLPLLAALLIVGCAEPESSVSVVASDPHAPAAPGWRQHDIDRPQPPRVDPAAQALPVAAPSDAIVLIGADGSGLDNWVADAGGDAPWRVEGGALVVEPGSGGIRTTEEFGDLQLHVEWQPAAEPEKTSQNRSNSGIFLVGGLYEVQVLDAWDNQTYADGRAGAIYGQFPPLADATLPPTEWQSYDIFFRMPRFGDDGAVLAPARMTVLHNGVLVQNNEALPGTTIWLESLPYEPHGPGPIALQDHGSPVRFRNLWVRRMPERQAPPPGYAQFDLHDLTAAERDRLVGTYEREEGGQFVIERLGDGLGMSMPWRPGVLRMLPVSATSFELAHTAGRLDFALDADGAVTGLDFTMGGTTYPATPE